MPLLPLHRKHLERYVQFRGQPLTVWQQLRLSFGSHVRVLILTSATIAFWLALAQYPYASFMAGFALGIIGCEIIYFRAAVKL